MHEVETDAQFFLVISIPNRMEYSILSVWPISTRQMISWPATAAVLTSERSATLVQLSLPHR